MSHVKKRAPAATETGDQIRQTAKENAETEDAGEETDRQREIMQHPGWRQIVVWDFGK